MKKLVGVLCVVGALTGCSNDDTAISANIARAVEQFEIYRRVVFFNGITDKYILQIEGACSIEAKYRQLEVTCKHHDGGIVKHHLGLSNNVSYFSEQITNVNVPNLRHRVIFKPTVIIPNEALIYPLPSGNKHSSSDPEEVKNTENLLLEDVDEN